MNSATIGKLGAPIALAAIGLLMVIFTFASGQNNIFLIGALGFTIAGAVSILAALDIFTGQRKLYVIIGLLVGSAVLLGLNYKSIMDPIEFNEEKDKRYKVVIQRLKDLRAAQLMYKGVNGAYCKNLDSLMYFINEDSVPVVKSIGTVPDTLTEQTALEMGIISRDTSFEATSSYVYNESYMKDRKLPLKLEQLDIIPFSGGEKFEMNAGEIEKNKVMVPVFEIRAKKGLILKGMNKRLAGQEKDLAVGSMQDATTSGNWGE